MGRLKLTIFHPRKASSDLGGCFRCRSWLGSTSTNIGSNFFSPVHGMKGLSDISMCWIRVIVAIRNLSTADWSCIAFPFSGSSRKKAKLSLTACINDRQNDNYTMSNYTWCAHTNEFYITTTTHTISIEVIEVSLLAEFKNEDLRKIILFRTSHSASLRVCFLGLMYTSADRNVISTSCLFPWI